MTRPAVSVTSHCRAASKTLASPEIVSGLFTCEFASGIFTMIDPRDDTSGVGAGVGVGVGDGDGVGVVGAGVGVRVGVGLFTTIVRSVSHALVNASATASATASLTSVAP